MELVPSPCDSENIELLNFEQHLSPTSTAWLPGDGRHANSQYANNDNPHYSGYSVQYYKSGFWIFPERSYFLYFRLCENIRTAIAGLIFLKLSASSSSSCIERLIKRNATITNSIEFKLHSQLTQYNYSMLK